MLLCNWWAENNNLLGHIEYRSTFENKKAWLPKVSSTLIQTYVYITEENFTEQ